MKKRPPRKPNEELYKNKVEKLEKYHMLEDLGKLDIYYFDESGFSISSNLPYLWSEINNTATVKTLSCKRINVLGFLSKRGKLKSFIAESRVNSDTVIEVFDSFVDTLTKPTIVVLDNASIHKSKKFKSHLPRWSNRGLSLLYLPPYSPELNIIETLWRFMKYTWIEYSAYLSPDNLLKYIQKIFDGYGKNYWINFDSV